MNNDINNTNNNIVKEQNKSDNYIICGRCGSKIHKDNKYCVYCGNTNISNNGNQNIQDTVINTNTVQNNLNQSQDVQNSSDNIDKIPQIYITKLVLSFLNCIIIVPFIFEFGVVLLVFGGFGGEENIILINFLSFGIIIYILFSIIMFFKNLFKVLLYKKK